MNAVVVDTDVYSALYVMTPELVRRRALPVDDWRKALTGARTVISFQSRAEMLSGAYLANWGAERIDALKVKLDATPTIHTDGEVVEAYARLITDAQASGHPFGDLKNHAGDRWIAASAIAKGLPILTGNVRHFTGAPRLSLVS